jgi:hypothetical protein
LLLPGFADAPVARHASITVIRNLFIIISVFVFGIFQGIELMPEGM